MVFLFIRLSDQKPIRRRTMMTILAPKLTQVLTRICKDSPSKARLTSENWKDKKYFPTEFTTISGSDGIGSEDDYGLWKSKCEQKLLRWVTIGRDLQSQDLSLITLGNDSNYEEMLYFISVISKNCAFLGNISCTRSAKDELKFETPGWFRDKSDFTLGEYISAVFESCLHVRVTFEQVRPKDYVDIFRAYNDIEQFWISLNECEKQSLLSQSFSKYIPKGSVNGSLVQMFLLVKQAALCSIPYRFLEYVTFPPLMHVGSELFEICASFYNCVTQNKRDRIYNELTNSPKLQCNLEVNVYDELINKSKDILLHQKYAELYKEYFDGKEKATPPSAKKKKKKKPSAKKEAETNSTNEGSEQLFSNEESIDLRLVFDGEQIEEEYDPSQTASKIVSSTLEYCSYEHKKEVHKNNIIPKSPTIRVKKHTHRIVEKKVVNHQYEEAVKMFSKLTGVAKEKKGDNKSDTTCLSEVSSDSKELKSAEETNFNAHREPGNEYIKIISEGYKLVKPLQYNVRQIEINQTSTAFESEINKFIYNMDSYMGKLDAFRVFCFHLLQKSLFDFYGGNYNIQAHVYGSVASGLALESSDMDIAISGIPINSREQLLSEFVKIKQHLEVIPQIKYIKPIFTAKVPILKLMMQGEVYPAIKVDLLIPDNEELPSHLLRCLHSVNMTKDILSKFKHTREIVIILKKLLNIRNFNSPYTGGLSSYALVLMVATFINHFSCLKSLPELLINILDFYGSYIDIRTIAISPLLTYFTINNPPAITVIDPLWHTNNVTEASFAFQDIREYLADISHRIICKLQDNQANILSDVLSA